MRVSDLIVEVRDANRQRVGQILPTHFVGLSIVLRFKAIGAWSFTLPGDHPLISDLRAPGAGVIITGPDGVLISGPMVSAKNTRSTEDLVGTWEFVGVDDSSLMWQRLAYPTPSTSDPAGQTSAYDSRSGAAETVVKGYVEANLGLSAPSERQVPGLIVEADLGRGGAVTGNARFDKLGELAVSLLLTSGLGFDIKQIDDNLVFDVFEPVDHSKTVRMDVDNLRLTKSEYSYASPEATRVIVAGQGQGSERTFIERASTDSLAAESSWGRRIEVFKDQRSTNATSELEQAGDEILAESGKTVEAISVSPSDDQTMQFGLDWGLGDLVTVVVGDQEISQIVTEVAIVITDEGVKVGATVGNPSVASSGDTEAQVIDATSSQEARISNLERNEASGSSGGGMFGNLDNGFPDTTFGGTSPVDGGSV